MVNLATVMQTFGAIKSDPASGQGAQNNLSMHTHEVV